MNKRATSSEEKRHSGIGAPDSAGKRKRYSASRRSGASKRASINRSICLDADKENQFTSTPIKSPESRRQSDAFRDVSNLTPKETKRKFARKIEEEFSPVNRVKHKKKKPCLDSFHNPDFLIGNNSKFSVNYFRPFEAVDSHIESLICDKHISPKLENRNYAPTLPAFAMDYTPCAFVTLNQKRNASQTCVSNILQRFNSAARTEDACPPNKKAKIDHVNDFLQQISCLTSPEERLRFSSANDERYCDVKISPLARRLVDLRFSKISFKEEHNDSSYINDLSLDEIVNAILDTSDECNKSPDNVPNIETRLQENLINSGNEMHICSPDSGFRSTSTERHDIAANMTCKCNNNNKMPGNGTVCDKTIINLEETFHERCVDVFKRQRSPNPDDFNLKRQKCVRRRKLISDKAKQSTCRDSEKKTETGDAFESFVENDECSNDNSFESSLSDKIFSKQNGNTPEIGTIRQETFIVETPVLDARKINRCLVFDSPNGDKKMEKIDSRGSMDLELNFRNGEIIVEGEFSL